MIHTIDLHYHAGQERDPGTTLRSYLEHAVMTGRRVVGVTDHLDLYLDPRKLISSPLYSQNVAGILTLRDEVVALQSAFPELKLLFAPEVPPAMALVDIPAAIIEIADYFICEAKLTSSDGDENTTQLKNRITEAAEFRSRFSKPVFIAHPLRHAIDQCLVKAPIPRWVRELSRRDLQNHTQEDLDRFFGMNVREVGRTAAAHNVPLEINGNTWERARASNLPAPLRMMLNVYRLWRDSGVEFVVGSDQHGFVKSIGRVGGSVPWEVCEVLGIEMEDIRFLQQVGVL